MQPTSKELVEASDAILESENNAEKFETLLKTYLSYHVPEIFIVSEHANVYDKDKIQKCIFDPIIQSICSKFGSNFDEISSKLNFNVEKSRPVNELCGHVFGNGEATYSCRNCATDGTCVMCYDCFMNSPHKNHKYRAATSGGTGYCDCGDIEAWKSDPCCDKHKKQFGQKSESRDQKTESRDQKTESRDQETVETDQSMTDLEESRDQMSNNQKNDIEKFKNRAKMIFKLLLQYAVELLCWDYSDILPFGLTVRTTNEDQPYHTVLFNDESHSFDDVIMALTKALDCTEDRASLYATLVDREGRASVRCGQLDYCESAKGVIKNLSTLDGLKAPLIVECMVTCLVSHQHFAIRLINWITKICQEFNIFLPMVTDIFMHVTIPSDQSEHSMLVTVLKKDPKLWKSARICLHQFIMGTILLNFETKKEFSKNFTRLYSTLVQDYIEDDHEHSMSVISLGLQMYTVPTLARYLISEENVVSIVMDCVLKASGPYIDRRLQRLNFESTSGNINFRRALPCLTDLKYLLTVTPEPSEWTDSLKRNFLAGFDKILQFMCLMHYMNAASRQEGNHQEFESEWEMGFNIQIRLNPIITQIQRWAATNTEILKNCFEKVQGLCSGIRFSESDSDLEMTAIEGFGYTVVPLRFNVSKDPVSVHIPIHRLLAGLYLNLCMTYPEYEAINKDSDHVIQDWWSYYEYPLRIFVLGAQVQAGTWRRNGYAIPNQLHNYTQNYCRTEMYDKDLLLMQIGAAKSDPNEFLLRVLHRFNLLHWIITIADMENLSDESCRVMGSLFDDFLQLLVIIFAERYTPGVGDGVTREDNLRYVIIQLLCKGPTAFSKLEKALTDDHVNESAELDEIVRSVANFRPPVGANAGCFQLKPEFFNQYNKFFYLYSKSDMTKAELYQSKERKSESLQIKACPPPLLPKFAPSFENMINIFNCQSFLHIISSILKRSCAKNQFSTEGHLHKALFLINLALNEQERAWKNCQNQDFNKLFDFSTIASNEKFNIHKYLEDLTKLVTSSSRFQNLCDLVLYTNTRFQELSSLVEKSKHKIPQRSSSSSKIDVEMTEPENQNLNNKDAELKKRREMAMRQREKAVQSIKNMQNAFVKKHKIAMEMNSSSTSEKQVNLLNDEDMEEDEEKEPNLEKLKSGPSSENLSQEFPACFNLKNEQFVVCSLDGSQTGSRDLQKSIFSNKYQCILCREDETGADFTQNVFVYAGFIQNSSLFSKNHMKALENVENADFLYPPADLYFGIHVSTCGHTMHWKCWQKYYESIVFKESRRILANRASSYFSVEKSEYPCPLCKRLSNAILPTLPPLKLLSMHHSTSELPYNDWVGHVKQEIKTTNQITAALQSENDSTNQKCKQTKSDQSAAAESVAGPSSAASSWLPLVAGALGGGVSVNVTAVSSAPSADIQESPGTSASSLIGQILSGDISSWRQNLESALRMCIPKGTAERSEYFHRLNILTTTFARFVYTNGLGVLPNDSSPTVALMCWRTVAFTIRSVDAVLKFDQKPLFGLFSAREKHCLRSLIRSTAIYTSNCDDKMLQNNFARLLAPIFGQDPEPEDEELEHPTPFCMLEIDAFSLLVELIFASRRSTSHVMFKGDQSQHQDHSCLSRAPESNPNLLGHICEYFYLLKVTLSVYSVQLLISCSRDLCDNKAELHEHTNQSDAASEFSSRDPDVIMTAAEEESRDSNLTTFLTFVQSFFNKIGLKIDWSRDRNSKNDVIIERFKQGLKHFLRLSALFFHFFLDIDPPEALLDRNIDEFVLLCRYLNLPYDLNEFVQFLDKEIIDKIVSHPRFSLILATLHFTPQPVDANQLIELPKNYSDLLNKCTKFKCPSLVTDDSRSPVLCLVCGCTLCSHAYCCQTTTSDGQQIGACTNHAKFCTFNKGLFLRIRDCRLMLTYQQNRGFYMPAPYVDEYGETDSGFRRGNPLYLNEEVYRRMRGMWLNQGIPETIANNLELTGSHFVNLVEWQHL